MSQSPMLVLEYPVKGNPDESSVLDTAARRLNQSAYLEIRRVRCDLRDGVLTLAGKVSSHYLRQVAQAAVSKLPGIDVVNNQLEVVSYGLNRDGWASE